jgi:hypothetical protein
MWKPCRVCGDDTGDPDFSVCGRCQCLTISERAELQRRLGRPAMWAPAPAAPAQPAPAAAEDTRAALQLLQQEESTRLERAFQAWRLELLLRPWPEWAPPR